MGIADRAPWGPAGLAAALIGSALACGSGEPPQPSGRPMAAVPPEARGTGEGENQAPEIHALRFEPSEPAPGRRVRAVADASDPDGDPIRLSYAWRHRGELVGAGAGVSTDGLSKGDRLELTVTASDGPAESDPVSTWVRIGNRRPQVAFVGIDPPDGLVPGRELRAVVEASDPDGDRLTTRYEWRRNGRPTGDRDETHTPHALEPGDEVSVRVWVGDGEDEARPVDSFVLRLDNRAPEIVSQPGGVREDGAFHYALEAVDPDGDKNLRFELLEGPEGMTLDPLLGELAWRPTGGQTGTFVVDVAVKDARGAASAQRFELTVENETEPPAPPAEAAP